MKNLLITTVFLFFSFFAFAQTGQLKGNIKDGTNQEPVIGANVLIEGLGTGASTDIEGNFVVKNVPVGTYNIVISYVGYVSKKIEGVKIEAGKVLTLETAIEEAKEELETVTVVAAKETMSALAVISEVRFAEQVAVGISAEQISKTQDRDASQVMRRIPGVSLIDDRFVMVRGLSERYNSVLINDALTPSAEVDTKAFSFDIIPTSAIDRMMIYKSGSAELPGEFAGGAIKIYTQNAPLENSTSFSFALGNRVGTTFDAFKSYKGSSTDFLGFDNGDRQLPSSFPANLEALGTVAKAEAAKNLPNNWTYDQTNALPDMRLGLNIARRFNAGKVQIGHITALNYSITRQTIQDLQRFRYLNNPNPTQKRSDQELAFVDNQNSTNVRLGLVHNWSFFINDNFKIEFRNLFSQMGTTETTVREGKDFVSQGADLRNYAFRYESRSIYSGQLNGTHRLNKDKTKLTWLAGLSYTNRQEPDFRRFRSIRSFNAPENQPFELAVPPGATTFDLARFYSKLNELSLTASTNFEHQIGGKEGDDNSAIKLRAGIYTEYKERDFSARWMSYSRGFNFNSEITKQPLDQIFRPENINGTTGFTMSEGTNPSDKYLASNTLAAGYISSFIPFSDRLSASVGFRVEYNRQYLESGTFGGGKVKVDNPVVTPLPSLNLTYNFTKNMQLRFGYAWTVNRPEFRELAPFSYYNFDFNVNIIGNPNLKTANIQNFDVRWELYPSPEEIIAIGAFYKHFTNPIETFLRIEGSGQGFTYGAANTAQSYGVEVEFRKSFYAMSGVKFIQDLTFVANASLIQSQVSLPDFIDLGPNGTIPVGLIQEQNRPMMNQSPYLINAGFYYNNEDRKIQFNILYNVIGKRVFAVGNSQYPTIYEMPRNVIDLSFIKGFGKNWELKVGVQDLLNAPFRLIQDTDGNTEIDNTIDETIMRFSRGQYVTAGISYKF